MKKQTALIFSICQIKSTFVVIETLLLIVAFRF